MRNGDSDLLKEINEQITALTKLHELNHDEHMLHHDYIRSKILEEEEKRKVWVEVKSKLAAGGAWALVTAVGSIVLYAFNKYTGH